MSDPLRAICPFCGMGCSLLVRPGSGTAYHGQDGSPCLDYDVEGPHNRGSLCAKGNMTLELLQHPKRLDSPSFRDNGDLRVVPWDRAADALVAELTSIRCSHGPHAIGVIVGPHLTIEETRRAVELVGALGSSNIDAAVPDDWPMLTGVESVPARPRPVHTVQEIEAMTAMLVVGDLFAVAPCIAKPILHARYDRRRNVLAVLGATVTRTGWFAKPTLVCRPGRETAALALMLRVSLDGPPAPELTWGDAARQTIDRLGVTALESASGLEVRDVAGVVAALTSEASSGVFFTSGFASSERPDLAAGLAALLAESTGSRFLAMPSGANARGVRAVLQEMGLPGSAGLTAAEMIEASVTGDIKALVVLGCDPVAAMPGRICREAAHNLRLLATTAVIPGETTELAHLVLPSQAWGEKPGTVLDAFGRQALLGVTIAAPGGARADLEILDAMIARLGTGPSIPRRAAADPNDGGAAGDTSPVFDELELYLRVERRRGGRTEAGSHQLLPRYLPPHAGDGSLTRHLSWPRHEVPEPFVSLSQAHAGSLGVTEGDRVLLRSRDGEIVLPARIEHRVPEGVVLASPHHHEVRGLMEWHVDPALRDLDLRPERVSVERWEGRERG